VSSRCWTHAEFAGFGVGLGVGVGGEICGGVSVSPQVGQLSRRGPAVEEGDIAGGSPPALGEDESEGIAAVPPLQAADLLFQAVQPVQDLVHARV
jgi:hypothetical protein